MSLIYYLKHPSQILTALWSRIGCYLNDETYLKIRFRLSMGYRLNLNNPKTFNEKLNWLKLHDRKDEYRKLVDKYEVKEYVSSIIGSNHVIPTLAVWDNVDDIDIGTLPDKFVLKATNGGGGSGVVICKDKATFNLAEAKKRLLKSSKTAWKISREWVYYDVKPRFIAEKYLEFERGEDFDYKFFCFNGIPKTILVCKDRFTKEGMSEDFFTSSWEHIDVRRPEVRNSEVRIDEPSELKKMLDIVQKLSKDITFVRVDMYSNKNNIYFGEMTFYPSGGFTSFDPKKYDEIFGSWLSIENVGGG